MVSTIALFELLFAQLKLKLKLALSSRYQAVNVIFTYCIFVVYCIARMMSLSTNPSHIQKNGDEFL